MSTEWLKNFCGLKCSDFEMLKVPNPKLEYTIHVTAKTVECATFFGSVIVGPLFHVINGKGTMRSSVVEFGTYGAMGGLIAGPILSAIKINQMSNIDLFDRCYRLRFSSRQLNIDRLSLLGGALGSALSGAYGFVLGVDLALLGNFLITGTTPISDSSYP